MFAIYDTKGLRFRDTLEKLRKVRPALAAARLDLKPNTVENKTQKTNFESSESVVSRQAQQAYKKMLHLNQREPIVHAYQLMSYPVITISMEMDVLAARKLFQQHKLHLMPVVNASQRLVGMLSIQDLLQFIKLDGDQISYVRGKRVSDIMSSDIITADPVSDIRRVASLMQEFKLHGVPIVDQHHSLLGIVSRGDILRAVINEPALTLWS